ncbi:MAG: MerR family transcriptional regulator [Candidatus Limnocylindrales bacterium]
MHFARGSVRADAWLSLGPASQLIGVAPDTLRRWADQGRVESFVTPGGHRRFSRRSLERLMRIASPGRVPLIRLGVTYARLASAYRRRYVTARSGAGLQNVAAFQAAVPGRALSVGRGGAWPAPALPLAEDAPNPVEAVDPAQRETFRLEGRQLIEALLAYLDASESGPGAAASAATALDQASSLVEALGVRLARSGVGLADAVTLFVAARRPFLDELAALRRRRDPTVGQFAEIYERASGAFDRLLVVLVQAHRDASHQALAEGNDSYVHAGESPGGGT